MGPREWSIIPRTATKLHTLGSVDSSCPMQAPFWAQAHGPVVMLVFGSKQAQHATLARVETFYESERHAGRYLSWDEARRERVCQGYEAFNLPAYVMPRWLAAMRKTVVPTDTEDEPWWHAHCSDEERALLADLVARGVLFADGTAGPAASTHYLIAALAAGADVSLAHERLHALYHFSPAYRALLSELWQSMPRAIEAAVQYDLQMRGYRSSVWEDELGAYLGIRISTLRRADPSLEFGNKSAPTCAEIRRTLLARIPQFWRDDVGIEEEALTISPEALDHVRSVLAPPRLAPKPKPQRGRRK